MINEKDIISKINNIMPRSKLQQNEIFESDSEVIKCDEGYELYNIDEFSNEDKFYEKNGYDLGWNIAVGTLSDIYASGGIPTYFGCSLTVNKMFNKQYIIDFAKGMADVLKENNTYFMGGDFGKSKKWRATCFAVGITEEPVKRSGAKLGDNIYITGEIGTGNLMAANLPYRFSSRKLPDRVTACIDTSDGVYNGINMIAEQSNVGFELFNIPYIKEGLEFCKKLRLPKEMLFFGEAGEYELLFTSPKELPFNKIGKITKLGKTLEGKDISSFDISARDYKGTLSYIKAVKRKCIELL